MPPLEGIEERKSQRDLGTKEKELETLFALHSTYLHLFVNLVSSKNPLSQRVESI